MNSVTLVRKIHRFAALIIGTQILLWTISGVYFSIVPIDEIRGSHLATPAIGFEASKLDYFEAPGVSINKFQSANPSAEITGVSLRHLRGRDVYYLQTMQGEKASNRLVDARTGEPLDMITRQEAELLASQAATFSAPITSVEFVETSEADSEFKGRLLPMFRVNFDYSANVSLYLDAWTGELVATRTTFWRAFDFLWMLHIMDYDERSDFNNNLLRIFAISALLFVISGFALWVLSSQWLRKRRTKKMLQNLE